mgnify:CR=1 FL=1
MKKWTEEEIEWLKENYKTASWEEILKKLPYTKQAISTKANRVFGLKKTDKEIQYRWTKEYNDFLKENYENGDMEEIMKVIPFPNHTIQCQANRFGLKRNKDLIRDFTQEDDEWLKENYGYTTKAEIENRFADKSYHQIQTHANSLGLKRVKREGKIFYQEDVEWIRENYSILPMEDILEHFAGKATYAQIVAVASKIGVSRPFVDYSNEELELMQKYYKSCKTIQEFQEKYLPHRTVSGINAKAQKMGLLKREDWTTEEDKVLIENYNNMFRWQLCKLFPNRPKASVFNRIIALGLTGGQGYAYRKEDDDFIINNYETMTDEEIGKVLHRATKSIKQRRNDLGYHRRDPDEITKYISLNRFLARQDSEWRKMAEIACNGKCLLSDNEYEDVHHLYARNLIVSEIVDYFNLPENFEINSCSKELKEQIILKYREIENQYGLGICLTEEIHTKFHSLYGFGSNIPEQFLSFVSNFFPEKLETIKEYIKTTN